MERPYIAGIYPLRNNLTQPLKTIASRLDLVKWQCVYDKGSCATENYGATVKEQAAGTPPHHKLFAILGGGDAATPRPLLGIVGGEGGEFVLEVGGGEACNDFAPVGYGDVAGLL